MRPKIDFLPDQIKVKKYWDDEISKEIVYGGSKAGGKSFCGCAIIFMNALVYDGTHYFIARKELNDLRKFTRPSIEEFFLKMGSRWDNHAKYNGLDNFYELKNGSRVYLLHAREEPNDPLFERFGSMQFTQGWIEEAGEFEDAAYNNLRISVGRKENKKYGLMGKMLLTCNPKKNFLYDKFYKPYKEGTLEAHLKFVQTYPHRNIFLSQDYIDNLESLRDTDWVAYQRLYLGEWEYEDDASALFDHEDVVAAFLHRPYIKPSNTRFLTIDPSGRGKDRTVMAIFRGEKWVERIFSFSQISSQEIIKTIKSLQETYEIPNRRVIYDNDGIGHYIGDHIIGAYGFKGGRPALTTKDRQDYPNLRAQMYYELSKQFKSGQIFIQENRRQIKGLIARELSAIKADKMDDDKLKHIIKKKEIIKNLGRSPDFADVLMMGRMGARVSPKLTYATA